MDNNTNLSNFKQLNVFVLMPYTKENLNLYDIVISPLCEKQGFNCTTIERLSIMKITPEILSHIECSDIILAITTGKNANVFYELGYAHAFSKLTILVMKVPRGNKAVIPFDIKDYQHILYSSKIDLEKKLEKKLKWAKKNYAQSNFDFIPFHLSKILGETTKFAQSISNDQKPKSQLGEIVYELIKHKSSPGDDIYFGPGTTVFEIFNSLYNEYDFDSLHLNIQTSNLTVLMKVMKEKIDNCRIIGDFLCREYASFYYSNIEKNIKYKPSITVMGISGLLLQRNNLIFRTCWEEQLETVRQITLKTKKSVIIPLHYKKLITSDGVSFLKLNEIIENCKNYTDKEYIMVINIKDIPKNQLVKVNSRLYEIKKLLNFKSIKIDNDFIILEYRYD